LDLGGVITGGWKKLFKDELHKWCSSPNIIMIIKSRRMRWAGHISHKIRNAYKVLLLLLLLPPPPPPTDPLSWRSPVTYSDSEFTSETRNLFLDIRVGLLGRGIGPSQGLCPHRTANQIKMR
jgi:hypothetical protein